VRTEKYSPREFRRLNEDMGRVQGAHYIDDEGESVIEIPYNASLRTRLHELGHAAKRHEGSGDTYSEHIRQELEADAWAYEKLPKKVSVYRLQQVFLPSIDELLEEGHSASSVFAWAMREIENAGYRFDRQARSNFWWEVRARQDALRGKE
jgi:hypothetical protein